MSAEHVGRFYPQRTGRPTSFKPDYVARAYNLCLLGLTDPELEHHFGCSIARWKRRFPEFASAIARGRDEADGEIAAALFKRAKGYDIERTKITKAGETVTFTEHIPADFSAMSLILRNRQSARWRERTVVEHDISDRVADRLEAARLRMLDQRAGNAKVIEGVVASAATDGA